MDNASKAIIMAGAVLIAIGLVGLGVYLYRSGSQMEIDAASKFSTREIQQINSTFEIYEGDCLGGEVVSLLRNTQVHNKNFSDYHVNIILNSGSYSEAEDAVPSIVRTKQYNVTFHYDAVGLIDEIHISG